MKRMLGCFGVYWSKKTALIGNDYHLIKKALELTGSRAKHRSVKTCRVNFLYEWREPIPYESSTQPPEAH